LDLLEEQKTIMIPIFDDAGFTLEFEDAMLGTSPTASTVRDSWGSHRARHTATSGA